MKIGFIPLTESEFNVLAKKQLSEGIVRTGSGRNISIFKTYRKPSSRQGGSLLSILASLGRKALPYLQKYVLPSITSFGKNVASDVINGNNFKKSFKKRGKDSLRELRTRVLSGRGRRRTNTRRSIIRKYKKKNRSKTSLKKTKMAGRRIARKKRRVVRRRNTRKKVGVGRQKARSSKKKITKRKTSCGRSKRRSDERDIFS